VLANVLEVDVKVDIYFQGLYYAVTLEVGHEDEARPLIQIEIRTGSASS
jgi:hypothetical protein